MNRTTLVVGAGIVLCAFSLFWLQGRFDKSDHAKAERLVRNFTVEGRTQTFEAFLLEKNGGRTGIWETEITGGCRGVVRVTWTLPGNPPTVYAWDVEIPSQGIHPTQGSPEGERMLREFAEPQKDLPPLDLPPLDAKSQAGNK